MFDTGYLRVSYTVLNAVTEQISYFDLIELTFGRISASSVSFRNFSLFFANFRFDKVVHTIDATRPTVTVMMVMKKAT